MPHGVRVLLCKQIKLSSGLGQGVKNAIRQRFRQRTAYHLQQNPLPLFSHSMENRLLFAFTSSIFCLLQSSTSSVITLLPVLLSVLLFLFEILPPLVYPAKMGFSRVVLYNYNKLEEPRMKDSLSIILMKV